jgi:hypothetical protein
MARRGGRNWALLCSLLSRPFSERYLCALRIGVAGYATIRKAHTRAKSAPGIKESVNS